MFQKCPNCSTRVIRGSKFCTNCGAQIPHDSKKKRRKVNENFMNIDFVNSKKLLKRYKNYFYDRIVDPTISMKRSMQKESFQFGVFQLIVIVLINSFTLLTLFGEIDIFTRPVFSVFLSSVVLHLLIFLNMVISLYIATNYLKKVPTNVQTIVSRIGGLASPLLILSFILYLAVLTSWTPFFYYIGIFGSILVGIAIINFYLLNIKNNSNIPVFYTLVIAMGVFLLVHTVTYVFLLRYSANPAIYAEIIQVIFG